MTLAEATAVHMTTPHRYAGTVPPGWDIAGATNGGYLLTTVARAVLADTGRPDPIAVSAHYLVAAGPGPVTVDVQPLDDRRRRATASASMRRDDGTLLLAALATVGEHGAPGTAEVLVEDGSPPLLPPPKECVRVPPTETFPPPFMGRVGVLLHPDDTSFMHGRPSGRAVMRGWFELLDDEPITTLALLLAADAFPPAVFNTTLPIAWTPTVELTVQVRGRPAPGPVACVFRSRFVTGGYLEADGEIWDADGDLVALSRQLALVPRAS
jgi:hypothetical protein